MFIGTANISYSNDQIKISDIVYLKQTHNSNYILERKIKSILDSCGITDINFSINFKSDDSVEFKKFSKYYYSLKDPEKLKKLSQTSKLLSSAFKTHFIYIMTQENTNQKLDQVEKKIKTTSSNSILSKKIINTIDTIFRKKVYQAKLLDVVNILFLGFLALSFTLMLEGLKTVALTTFVAFVSSAITILAPIFTALGVTLGIAIIIQGIIRFTNAQKSENKEEKILGIANVLFGVSLLFLGATSTFAITLLPVGIGICSGFSFGFALWNLVKIAKLKEKLKDFDKFLENEIIPTNKKCLKIEKIIEKLDEKSLDKHLKKYLHKNDYQKYLSKTKNEKIALLKSFKLQKMQEKKIFKLEQLLGSEITKELKKLITSVNEQNKKELQEKIQKELFRRKIGESIKLIAPIINLSAFGMQLSTFENPILQNMLYYWMTFISTLIAAPLNYIKRYRNVPTDEKKDPVYLIDRLQLIPKKRQTLILNLS
ncbi:MAG: hypothetical protein JXA94_04000 [Parachlamydiales bacterium]|nr:hypothetical protein [Parachlamydiales bacterium]